VEIVAVNTQLSYKSMSYNELGDYQLKDALEKLMKERGQARQRQLNLTQHIAAIRNVLRKRGYNI
jgi:hypothetical protein